MPSRQNRHESLATQSAVLHRAADGCTARMMRKPNRARLMSDASLLLSYVIRLLFRHERDRAPEPLWRSL